MITGIVPEDALERAVKDTVKEPSKLGVKIGANTETALMNALNVKISGRTQSAQQFEDELMSNVVKRVVVKKQQIDIGKWPLWVKVSSAIGAVVIAVLAGVIATSDFSIGAFHSLSVPEGKTRVPNVVNEEMETAFERGEQANLTVQVYDKQYSDTIPENRVLSQDIKGGTLVDSGSTLSLVISAGIEKTYVPNVVGMKSDAGIQALKDAGLVVSSEEKEYRAAPGTIGWQSLDGETETDTGTEISVIISRGISGGDSSKTENVDDVVGLDYESAAEQMLEKYLYLVKVGSEYSDDVPAGSILRQKPEGGSRLNQNSNVEVYVSLGRELISVPDVQYKTQEEAVQLLEEMGLTGEVRQEASTSIAAGNVIRQETASGSKIEKGASVVIYISTGAPAQNQNNNEAPARENNNNQTREIQQETPNVQSEQQTVTQETQQADPNRNSVFDLLN
jgi:beta-lactam-binding protein with PASTA domain